MFSLCRSARNEWSRVLADGVTFSSVVIGSLAKVLFAVAAGVLTMADINEVVVRGSAAGFAQEIVAGRHPLTADEPVAAGGADTGPTPYDLLLAALGA
jgi:hypothetical protein